MMKSKKIIVLCCLTLLVVASLMGMWTFLFRGGWGYIESPLAYKRVAALPNNSEDRMVNQSSQQQQQQVVSITNPRPISISTTPPSPALPLPTLATTIPTITKKPDCWRRCDHRINKIVYADMPYVGAGINDRGYTLGNLANLAGYLCATVDYPKPHIMLGTMHNHKKKVSVNSTWSDYYNFTFYQDGSPAVHDLKDNPDDPMVNHPIVKNMYNGDKYINTHWLRVETVLEKTIVQDFQKVEAFSRSQEAPNNNNNNATTPAGFIWVITPNWYKVIPHLKDLLPLRRRDNYTYIDQLPDIVPRQGGCRYYNTHLPDHMQAIFDQTLTDIRNANEAHAKIGFFHIRRGDTKDQCNTTLPKMKEYTSCSFNGTRAKARNITLLLASDERDPEYRQGIKNIVQHEFDHIQVIDIDALILEKVKASITAPVAAPATAGAPEWRLNNFYLFRLVASFKWNKELAFTIEQRRHISCRYCDYLSSWKVWDSTS
jgi:hypothetical protein